MAPEIEREKVFQITDGSVEVTLGWQSAVELPDCRKTGIVAARKSGEGYEFASGYLTCPSCWERFCVTPKGEGEERSRNRRMKKVDLKGATVVEVDCADIADALLDRETLGILELTGNVAIDEEDGLYAVCPSCGAAFPVAIASGESFAITIRNEEDAVIIEDSFGRAMDFWRNGGFGYWLDLEYEKPTRQLGGMSVLKNTVLGVSAEARRYLDASLGLSPGKPAITDGIDLFDTSVRSRFHRNYDSIWHQDVKDVVSMVDYREGSNLQPGSELFKLPRDFDGAVIPKVLAANQWPNTADVRKAVKDRLAIAVLLAYGGAGRICGSDPETVSLFLHSFAVDASFVYALYDYHWAYGADVSDLFLIAAKEEKPADLVKALLKMGPSAVRECRETFRSLGLRRLEAYAAYLRARREHSLEQILSSPEVLGSCEARMANVRIRYPDGMQRLCGDYGGFRFSLAGTTNQITAMGRGLDDGYPGGFEVLAAFGEYVVMMVASAKRYVAMIRVNPFEQEVVGAHVRRGKRLKKGSKLQLAISEWAEMKSLSMGSRLFSE